MGLLPWTSTLLYIWLDILLLIRIRDSTHDSAHDSARDYPPIQLNLKSWVNKIPLYNFAKP